MQPASRGFTLIELMITVGILAALAALAIPRYLNSVFRARQAEARILLHEAWTQQYAHFGAHDCFETLTPAPATAPDPSGLAWSTTLSGGTPCDGTPKTFGDLGMEPTSRVYYIYGCTAAATPPDFTCEATGDLDANGRVARFMVCSDTSKRGAGIAHQGRPCGFPGEVFRSSQELF